MALFNPKPDKKRLIGILNFLAELFMVGIIKFKIILNAANELFQNFFILYHDKNQNFEYVLEGLIKFFDRIGLKLE
jgi:hypothetical protein